MKRLSLSDETKGSGSESDDVQVDSLVWDFYKSEVKQWGNETSLPKKTCRFFLLRRHWGFLFDILKKEKGCGGWRTHLQPPVTRGRERTQNKEDNI